MEVFAPSTPAFLLLALLLAATVDARLRRALGLLQPGPEGAVWIHGWCRRITRALKIDCTVLGPLPDAAQGFQAVVSNHLSYLDILLYSAVRPFVMVSKTEVRGWPLLGWLIAQAGTVFVDRGGGPRTYPAVNAAMAQAFRSGLPVLFFPEGTTTDGAAVLPFRRGLFHSILKDRVEVTTAALSYSLSPARPNRGASVAEHVCWWGDAAFTPHLFRFLALRGVCAQIRFNPQVIRGEDRFTLSECAHRAVEVTYTRQASCLTVAEPPGHTSALTPGVPEWPLAAK